MVVVPVVARDGDELQRNVWELPEWGVDLRDVGMCPVGSIGVALEGHSSSFAWEGMVLYPDWAFSMVHRVCDRIAEPWPTAFRVAFPRSKVEVGLQSSAGTLWGCKDALV